MLIRKKIIIGTANAGKIPYGLNKNFIKKKKIFFSFIKKFFNKFDTARTYGSENTLGKFSTSEDIIFSKLKPIIKKKCNNREVIKIIEKSTFNSLKDLKRRKIYCFYFHRVKDYFLYKKYIISYLKKKNLCRYIGVSLDNYSNSKKILNDRSIKFIQLPVNIFDKRWKKFIKKKPNYKIIIARSIFLQGILFVKKKKWPDKIKKYYDKIQKKFLFLKKEYKIDSFQELMLLYVFSIKEIDHVILSCNNIWELKQNMKILKKKKFTVEQIAKIENLFNIKDEKFINPAKWKL